MNQEPQLPPLRVGRSIAVVPTVYLRKNSLKLVVDETDPQKHLVAFKFDASDRVRITVSHFREDEWWGPDKREADGRDTIESETDGRDTIKPITREYEEGYDQEFEQPPGTGIDFSKFKEAQLLTDGRFDPFPLSIKLEASLGDNVEVPPTHITHLVIKRKHGDLKAKVAMQTYYHEGMMFRVGNLFMSKREGNIREKCVVCMSYPRDTVAVPCQHLSLCGVCREQLLKRNERNCVSCRQPVDFYSVLPIPDTSVLKNETRMTSIFYIHSPRDETSNAISLEQSEKQVAGIFILADG